MITTSIRTMARMIKALTRIVANDTSNSLTKHNALYKRLIIIIIIIIIK